MRQYQAERLLLLAQGVPKGSESHQKRVPENGALKVCLRERKVVPIGAQRVSKKAPKSIKNRCLGSLGAQEATRPPFGSNLERFGEPFGRPWASKSKRFVRYRLIF